MLDQNNNGYVDQEEYQEGLDQLDTNNDGQISQEEAEAQPNLYQDLRQHSNGEDPFAQFLKKDRPRQLNGTNAGSMGDDTWYNDLKANKDAYIKSDFGVANEDSPDFGFVNRRDDGKEALSRKRKVQNYKNELNSISNKLRDEGKIGDDTFAEGLKGTGLYTNKEIDEALNPNAVIDDEGQLASPKGILGAALKNIRDGVVPGDTSEKADLRPFRPVKPNSDPDSERLGLNFSDEDRLNWNKGKDRRVGDYTLDQWKSNMQEALDKKDADEVETLVESDPEAATQVLNPDSDLHEEATQILEDDDKRNDEVRNDVVEEALDEPDVIDRGLEDQNQYGDGISAEELAELEKNADTEEADTGAIGPDSDATEIEDETIIPEEATHDYFADLLNRRRNRNLPAVNGVVPYTGEGPGELPPPPPYEADPETQELNGPAEQLGLPGPEQGDIQLADIPEEEEEPRGKAKEEKEEKKPFDMDLSLKGGHVSGPGHKDYDIGDSFVSGTTPVSFDDTKAILESFRGSAANGIPGVATLDGISEDKFNPETENPTYSKEGENLELPEEGNSSTTTGPTGSVSRMFNDIMRGAPKGNMSLPHTANKVGVGKGSSIKPKAKGRQEATKMTPLKLGGGTSGKKHKAMNDSVEIIYERIIDKALKNYKSWPLANDGESHVKEKGGIAIYVRGDWISVKMGSYRKTLLDTFINEHPQFAKNILEVVNS